MSGGLKRILRAVKSIIAPALCGYAAMELINHASLDVRGDEAFLWETAVAAGCGAVLGSIYNTFARDFHHPIIRAPQILMHTALMTNMRGNLNGPDAQLEELENSRHLMTATRYHANRGQVLASHGQLEAALQEFELTIHAREKEGRPQASLIERIAKGLGGRIVESMDKDYQDISDAMEWFLYGDDRMALKCWDKAMERFEDDIEVNTLYARALGAMGRSDEANDQWSRTAHLIQEMVIHDDRILEDFDGEKQVFLVQGSEILEADYMVRVSPDKRELETHLLEVQIATTALKEWFRKEGIDDLGVVEGVAVAPNGMYSFFSRYEKGDTLHEYLKREGDHKTLYRTTRFLAAIHSLLSNPGLPRTDPGDHILERIDELEDILDDEIGEDTYRHTGEYHSLMRELRQITELPCAVLFKDEYVFNRDAHTFNWIVTEAGKIVAIDLEAKGLVKRSYDLSKQVELGTGIPNDAQGDTIRREAIRTYHRQASKMKQRQLPDVEELEFWKLNGDLLSALSFYAATFDRESYDGHRESYIESAIYSAQRLQREFLRYTDEEDRLTYSRWEAALGKLLKTGDSIIYGPDDVQNQTSPSSPC